MSFEKALVEVFDDPSQSSPSDTLSVQFNPGEYTLEKRARYAATPVPGLELPALSFVRGETEELAFELYFDTSEEGEVQGVSDVRKLTQPFFDLVRLKATAHAPPIVRFTWGEGLSFRAVVEQVSQRFSQFSVDGVPQRATLTLKLKQFMTLEEQLKALNLQSSDHVKTRVVRRGDTLAGIAAREYGDPGAWKIIAEENPEAITNPRNLVPGMVLRLPRLDARGRPVGARYE